MFEDRRGSWVVYAIAAVLVMAAGLKLFGQDGQGSPPPQVSGPGTADLPGADAEAGPGTDAITVHVAGAVRDPGVYSLDPGARADAAVREAGGFASGADRTAVNLATALSDGQQVLVPKRVGSATTVVGDSSAHPPAGTTGTGGTSASDPVQKVSLASATAEQIDAAVEGFGPTLAARVVEFRDQNGVTSVEGLREVPGIGDVRFQALAAALGP